MRLSTHRLFRVGSSKSRSPSPVKFSATHERKWPTRKMLSHGASRMYRRAAEKSAPMASAPCSGRERQRRLIEDGEGGPERGDQDHDRFSVLGTIWRARSAAPSTRPTAAST